jgi:hypothetical protein
MSLGTEFIYGQATLADLRVQNVQRSPAGRVTIREVSIDGQPVVATRRFWRSFYQRFGINESIFRYFSPTEVFQRVSERRSDDAFQFCLAAPTTEQKDADHRRARMLAVSGINRPLIRYREVVDLVTRYGGEDLKYRDGVITSTHAPARSGNEFHVGADSFEDRFCLETPVDGYGHPKLFLSLLRQVCSNGMVGYARAFRSDIPVGKHMDHCIARALESFDHQDGYSALRHRFESSQTSWASIHECLQLGVILDKLNSEQLLTCGGLIGRFRALAGNLNELYGLANLEALSDKRRRILPSRARVYDLLNFASEVATHHAKPEGAVRLQAFIGSLISDEFDLEGSAEQTDFDAFFIEDSEQVVRPVS